MGLRGRGLLAGLGRGRGCRVVYCEETPGVAPRLGTAGSSSKTDLLLVRAEPISSAGSTSVIYLRRAEKNAA